MDYRKLKGNLGLKSSALAPTACKLSSQFLVLDHMSNHYMKIARAKSAIDSRPPKSLATSQKMRDRMTRDRIARSPVPSSHSSVPDVNMYEYEDILRDEPEDEEEKLVHSIMRSTLLDKTRGGSNTMNGSVTHTNWFEKDPQMSQKMQQISHDTHYSMPYETMNYDQPNSVRSVKSGHSLTSSASKQAIPTIIMANRIIKGDVLEKRPHLFTEPERPFTPRTLKKNIESRLKHSKCYNPPRIKHGGHTENSNEKGSINMQNNNEKGITNIQNNNDKGTTKVQENRSPPKTNKHQKIKDASNNLQKTSQLSDSMLMDITVHSRDEIYGQNVNHNVPPLAITKDQDHMNWLQEQATKAEIRVRNSGHLKSSLHSDDELHPKSKYPSYKEPGLETDAIKGKQRKDEEQKYLAFAKEVTDDVLSRGISTDSVLYRVFENHIERRKSDLDESRMRKVISDLRKNLGLNEDSLAKGQTLASLSDSNYNKLVKESNIVRHSSSSNQHNVSSKSATNGDLLQDLSQTNLHPEMGFSLQSDSTLKFGQTEALLSTINSETNHEVKGREARLDRYDSANELTETQMWKQYELSLTTKEEKYDSSNSVIKDEHAVSKKEDDKVTHSLRQKRSAFGERRMAEEEKLDISSRKKHKVRGSQRSSSMDTNIDGEAIYSGTSHPNSPEHVNHKEINEEIFNRSKDFSLSQESNKMGQKDQDNENVSVISQTSSQQPTAKPRTRFKKLSQDNPNIAAPIAADEQQGNETHITSEVRHDHKNVSTKKEPNVNTAQLELNTMKDVNEVDRRWDEHHNDHQQNEENDYYEEDYEEIIDGEEDGQDDSADDF